MKTAILLSFSDLGKNKRLLHHAKNLVYKKDFKVILVGFDITDIPKDIKSITNISFRYIFPFGMNNNILKILLWPLLFLLYFIQILSATSNLTTINLIICSSTYYFTETLCGYLLSLIFHSILVFDISTFTWYENRFSGLITKKMLALANFVICPTHEMEILLKLQNLHCFYIPTPPDSSFRPNKQSRIKICEVFNFDYDSIFIAVPIFEFDDTIFTHLIDASNDLKQSEKPIIFLIFGSGKSASFFENKIKNMNVLNVSFKFIPFQYNLYPFTLGICDVGIYFHHKDYVIDAPPCLLDMISCELPIITCRYGCSQSFIKDSRAGGILLDNYDDLGAKLKDICVTHVISLSKLRNDLRTNLNDQSEILWNDAFIKIV